MLRAGLRLRLAALGRGRARRWHDVVTEGRLGQPPPSPRAGAPSLLVSYAAALHEYPAACAAVGATCAAAVGDAIAQVVGYVAHWYDWSGRPEDAAKDVHASSEPNLKRSAVYAATGGILVGVGGDLWHRRLIRQFPGNTYDAGLRFILDQASSAFSAPQYCDSFCHDSFCSVTLCRPSLHPLSSDWW